MIYLILAIFIWYFAIAYNQVDIQDECKKNGIANGMVVNIKCQEMKLKPKD